MIELEQLKKYQASKYCLAKYRGIDSDTLYKQINNDSVLKTQLNFFLNTIRPKSSNVAYIEKKYEPTYETNRSSPTKNIFSEYTDESLLTKNEVKVRSLFFQELDQGCSSCRRASLIRKYSNMLRELNSSSQEKEQTEE